MGKRHGTNGVVLKDVVGHKTGAKLAHVSLGHMEAIGKDLVAFVQRHAKTLRSLKLNTIDLICGEWRITIQRMQACPED